MIQIKNKEKKKVSFLESSLVNSGFILFYFIFWLRWVFVAVRGLSLVVVSGGYSSCRVRASHCGGFSCCSAQPLGVRASVVVARGLSSCGSWA